MFPPAPTTDPTATDTPQQTREVILSLGSNQGDRRMWLRRAGDALRALPQTRLTAHSPIYETEPVGVPPRFSNSLYLNCVVVVETRLAPDTFSRAVHAIEANLGRTRGDSPNLPRTLDIDIVAIDSLVSDSPNLTLPHPRARCRRFVLQPLADLRPDYRLPGESQTVSSLLQELPPTPRVIRCGEDVSSSR